MERHEVVIVEAEGADPARDRIGIAHDAGRTTVVFVPDGDAAVAVAREAAGADRIELCGGFGPRWQQRVVDAVEGRVPVGAVMFGFESLAAAAAYQARFGAGERLAEAFVVVAAGADVRRVRTHAHGTTTVVAVADPPAAAVTAKALVDDGITLLELYGPVGQEAAAGVIDAVAGRAAVGVVSDRRG